MCNILGGRVTTLRPMVADGQNTVARTRGLLTKNDREVLRGEKGDENRQRNVKWEVQKRIEEELPTDVEILAEKHPELFELLQSVVCNEK